MKKWHFHNMYVLFNAISFKTKKKLQLHVFVSSLSVYPVCNFYFPYKHIIENWAEKWEQTMLTYSPSPLSTCWIYSHCYYIPNISRYLYLDPSNSLYTTIGILQSSIQLIYSMNVVRAPKETPLHCTETARSHIIYNISI